MCLSPSVSLKCADFTTFLMHVLCGCQSAVLLCFVDNLTFAHLPGIVDMKTAYVLSDSPGESTDAQSDVYECLRLPFEFLILCVHNMNTCIFSVNFSEG